MYSFLHFGFFAAAAALSFLSFPANGVAVNTLFAQQGAKHVAEGTTAANDLYGNAVAIAGDGSVIFVGQPGYLSNRGSVTVNRPDGSALPTRYIAGSTNTKLGTSVDTCEDGSVVISGAPEQFSGVGRAFYRFANGTSTILSGGSDARNFGFKVTMSSDAARVCVASNYTTQGRVHCFHAPGVEMPESPFLPSTLDSTNQFGASLTMAKDGSMFVVGAPGQSGNNGSVYVFRFLEAEQTFRQDGVAILPPNSSYKFFGQSLAVDYTGQIIAIGGLGYVLVYQLDNDDGSYPLFQTILKTVYNLASTSFGLYAVALSPNGTRLVIGDIGYGQMAEGAIFSLSRDASSAANQFVPDHPNGIQATGLIAPSYLGVSLALNTAGTVLVVGAYGDNSTKGAFFIFTSEPITPSPTETPTFSPSTLPTGASHTSAKVHLATASLLSVSLMLLVFAC